MKNLKSYEDHIRLLRDIKNGKARVITYAMTDTNYTHYLFAKEFFSVENVIANFDSDENKWGQKLGVGVTTMPLDVINEMSKKVDGIIVMSEAIFQIGVYLETLGLSFCHVRLMDEKTPLRLIKKGRIEKNIIGRNEDELNQARSLLTDRRSQKVYDYVIAARTTNNPSEVLSKLTKITTDDQYFPEQVPSFLPLNDEVFVDGGAFDGDTIRKMMKLAKEKRVYRHIYAFEPDPKNYSKLCQFVSDDTNIKCYEKGLYSKETTLEFFNDLGGASRVKSAGESDINHKPIKIEVCNIDNVIKDRVTYIKMDIEGSELEALKGAEKTIRLNKPKLAISLYHKIEDFWEIPKYIKEIVPEYKLYANHHKLWYECVDTVLYALI